MWDQIRSNQRRTAIVVGLMGAILVATGAALGMLVGGTGSNSAALSGAVIALIIWFVLWLVAFQGGDAIMLSVAGAREISKSDHPRLFNVVEEMAIAASLRGMPRVFIVDDPSPNAFATGRRPEKAGVTVTTGLLSIMNRDELQGVIAHELGHIKNRDVALITTAGVMIGTIVLLAEFGQRLLWWGGAGRRSRSDKNGGGAQAVMFVVAIVFLILAPILAQLLYFALSRRREYMADASGALFTRYPEGLASALEKIGGAGRPLANTSRVTAPMYIAHPLQAAASATSTFSTHPPLEQRIRILRSMAGGAGLRAYEAAYQSVRGSKGIGSATLAAAQDVGVRSPFAGDVDDPVEPATRTRAREASNAFLAASGFTRIACTCGAVLKVPPSLAASLHECPRCGSQVDARITGS